MNAGSSAGYEHAIMMFYVHNVVVALPLTILITKLVVRFVTREPAKDVFRSVLVLPLDLVYVALGLLLAGIARRIPAFVSHYQNDKEADFAGIVLCLGLFVVACLLTWMDRGVRLLWQKFYAAWSLGKQTHPEEQQMLLLGQPEVRRVSVIHFWMFAYWALMIPIAFLEAILSVESLGAILKRLQ
jgi:hypothetical protein